MPVSHKAFLQPSVVGTRDNKSEPLVDLVQQPERRIEELVEVGLDYPGPAETVEADDQVEDDQRQNEIADAVDDVLQGGVDSFGNLDLAW